MGAEVELFNLGALGKTTEEMMNPETYASWGASLIEEGNVEKGYPMFAWELDENGEKSDPVWIIGTGTGNGDPVAIPLSTAVLYLSFLIVGGFVFFRTDHTS